MSASPDLPRVAVIMAGGAGERFWPLSRRLTPKQVLPLRDGGTLLDDAHARIAPLVAEDRVFVQTTSELAETIRTHAPAIPGDNVLTEPMRRNTAACLALAAARVEKRHGEAVMAVTTADHVVGDVSAFQVVFGRAFEVAARADVLIVFGVVPDRPETGYGYIETGDVADPHAKLPCCAVKRFCEKPDLATATAWLADGGFLWNSGMFVWRTGVLHAALEEHAPEYAWRHWPETIHGSDDALRSLYAALPNLPIDCAVLEKAQNIWALPAAFDWMDVGGWEAARALMTPDAHGNATHGEVLVLDTRGSTLHSSGPLIAALGVENLAVIATPDAVMICPRDRVQEIKRIVQTLQETNQENHL